jgi:hypothetical protein
MFDHVSIGVSDIGLAKRFYDAALKPLGYSCLSEAGDSLGYGRERVAFGFSRPSVRFRRTKIRVCIFVSRRRHERPWMRFMPRLLQLAGAITADPGSVPITVPIITLPL